MGAQEGSVEVVQALLRYGANPNLVREDGCSPLIIASEMGHEHVVKTLLEANNGYETDISIHTINGYDAASVAANENIVELLHNHEMDNRAGLASEAFQQWLWDRIQHSNGIMSLNDMVELLRKLIK